MKTKKQLLEERKKAERELNKLVRQNYRIFQFLSDEQRRPMLELANKLEEIDNQLSKM